MKTKISVSALRRWFVPIFTSLIVLYFLPLALNYNCYEACDLSNSEFYSASPVAYRKIIFVGSLSVYYVINEVGV